MTQRHALLEQLSELKLSAMARGFEEQLAHPETTELNFEERLGLLLDREITDRNARRLTQRLRRAKLRYPQAAMEDLEIKASRGMDRRQILELRTCRFVEEGHNVIVTGATGVGKTYLACALAHQACRSGHSVLYRRLPELFRELTLARSDGSYGLKLQRLQRADLLVLDDWALHPFGDSESRDLYEILEDRCGQRSTIVLSQPPTDAWHKVMANATLADAILDRLIHGSYKIELMGESQRGNAKRGAQPEGPEK